MDPVLVAVAVALIAPLGAYLVAARQFSGKIESSDAKELWAESKAIREWSQARIADLYDRVRALEQSNDTLERENRECARQVEKMDATIAQLHGTIADLTADLQAANARLEAR